MKRLLLAIGLLGVIVAVPVSASAVDPIKAYESGDFKAAAAGFEDLAKAGNAMAQNNLAVMYANGQGVKQDFAKAAEWYTQAAEQGLPVAQYNLGVFYENGQGVEQDDFAAAVWYQLAAIQGDPLAQHRLGVLLAEERGVDPDVTQAYMWLSLAIARAQDPRIQNEAAAVRTKVAKRMSRQQIVDAELMVGAWQPSR